MTHSFRSAPRDYQYGDVIRDIDWNVTARHATAAYPSESMPEETPRLIPVML